MAQTNTVARTMHDVGLATWAGGSLMGAIGLNGAASAANDPRDRSRIVNQGWSSWTPVNLAGIAAHLAGGLQLTRANKGRLAGQQGVARMATAKTALTAAALGTTAYARVLGKKIEDAGDIPVAEGTEPTAGTPSIVSDAQRQLAVLQWAIPALTGALLLLNARMGEQQRPKSVIAGMAQRVNLKGSSKKNKKKS